MKFLDVMDDVKCITARHWDLKKKKDMKQANLSALLTISFLFLVSPFLSPLIWNWKHVTHGGRRTKIAMWQCSLAWKWGHLCEAYRSRSQEEIEPPSSVCYIHVNHFTEKSMGVCSNTRRGTAKKMRKRKEFFPL